MKKVILIVGATKEERDKEIRKRLVGYLHVEVEWVQSTAGMKDFEEVIERLHDKTKVLAISELHTRFLHDLFFATSCRLPINGSYNYSVTIECPQIIISMGGYSLKKSGITNSDMRRIELVDLDVLNN